MPHTKKYWIAVAVCLLTVQAVRAQDPAPEANQQAFRDFVEGFEAADLPFNIDPPMVDVAAYPEVTDQTQRKAFLRPHGLGQNTEVRKGHVLYGDTAFVALTVLVSLGEERAWYLITFSPAGQALDKVRVGAFSESDGSRYEHWSRITETLQLEQTSMYRYFAPDGEEEACTRTRWQWQLQADGHVDTSAPEHNEDCSQ